MRIVRRHALPLLAVLVLASSCLARDGVFYNASTTRVRSAALTSTAPPLGLFVMRVAATDIGLSQDQLDEVRRLLDEAEVSVRPIDEARTVLIEGLVRQIETDRVFQSGPSDAAAREVVSATSTSVAVLRDGLMRLHALLRPEQRRALVRAVTARESSWARSWGAASDDAWLDRFAAPLFDAASFEEDARATANAWATHVVAEVRASVPLAALDEASRRALIRELRD